MMIEVEMHDCTRAFDLVINTAVPWIADFFIMAITPLEELDAMRPAAIGQGGVTDAVLIGFY